MTHGSLFSGIGGFDLAAEWIGWDNKFHCEWNEFGQKVLKYYWPNAESFTDIKKTNFTKYENKIDVLTGGFPCQPYSLAGKRKGKEDERHLWPEMLRAIKEIQPRWIVGENVFGLVNWSAGLVFHEVQLDLENQGYTVFPMYFQLRPLTRPTEEIGFGLLPTPTAFDSNNPKMKSNQTKKGSMHSVNLTRAMTMGLLPTPTAANMPNSKKMVKMGRISTLQSFIEVNLNNSQLNPQFVMEMMGFPPNWTALPFQNGKMKQ